ncbi:MAG: glycosyltransferase family 2 protein [Patescibacteria group bacterium]|nr:glycosyltransferase family 2 protein [Patescibacteria group bacterium]MDD5715424.1 glycosyltransferase family 2 protein [Patescibacteria group bacterium]
MPVFNIDLKWLNKAINSVKNQSYANWELCIADDCSTNEKTVRFLKNIQDQRIRIVFLKKNAGIAAASNEALKLASGEYVTFLDHDDELTPDALYEVAKKINETGAELIYSDEDKITPSGTYIDPHFKPDYSPDLLLSQNYICHLSAYKKRIIDALGGLRRGFDGSQDHDLLLRFTEKTAAISHISKVLYHWRAVPGSVAHTFSSKSYAWEAGQRALQEALYRRNIGGTAFRGKFPGTYRIKRTIKKKPLISIIIPFKNHVSELKKLIHSITTKSTYDNFEIIGIDNNSTEQETIDFIKAIQKQDARIKIFADNAPFNYSRLNNYGASRARGEHLLLLNNDTEIISPDWIERLLCHSQRDEVGIVGAKLYYFNNTIQHAGIIIGIGGVAGHPHKFLDKKQRGYMCRPHLTQNVSAVTTACAMIKSSLYKQLGGLDEKNLPIAFNDVDFCLRLREKGYLNIFTPECELYHYESRSRGQEDSQEKKDRFAGEVRFMQKRHQAIVSAGDPYYNPNLTLENENFWLK